MERLRFLNEQGDFALSRAQDEQGVYFPLVNEGGMISCVTPLLAGDCKTSQNTYLLAPASAETLHESRAARNFWVRLEGCAPWSAVGQSAPQQAARFGGQAEEAVLEGGLLWQRVTRIHRPSGLKAEVLSFVPAGSDRIEILQVTLTNTGADDQTMTPVAAVPLYGRSADNIRDHRHVTSLLHRVNVTPFGVELRPTMTFDERGHQLGQLAYRVYGAEEDGMPPVGFVPLVRDFVGSGSYDWPEAVVCPDRVTLWEAGQTAQGGEAVAALYFKTVTLGPGEARHYQIVLSIGDDPTPYLRRSAVEDALHSTRSFWQKVSAVSIHTQNADMDAWMRWVAVQPVLRRICGCSFLPHHDYGRGGRGWRDLWQDSLALLLTDPAKTRDDLLHYFAGVRTDGTNATIIGAKPGEFKADRNGIARVWMDHGFWPLLTVQLYLNETGDTGFLLERQPYFRDTLAHRGEGQPLQKPGVPKEGTVLEHLLIQAVTAFFDVGRHGHMRLRGGDWNDGLDMARTQGESVAFTAAYAGNFDALAELTEKLGGTVRIAAPLAALLEAASEQVSTRPQALEAYCRRMEQETEDVCLPAEQLAARLRDMGSWLKKRIRETEWVGDGANLHWFNSYYDEQGRQVEGLFGDSVRMMLTGQVFCLLSGTADDAQAAELIRAADWYLWDASRGGCCLNTDFGEIRMDLGRMFGFAYGSKENGAVFCHMAVMYAYALYSRSFAREGWKVLEQLYLQSRDFDASHILPGIPEYFDERGQGMYPYLTGAGSWMMLTLQCQVFGVRGEGGNLCLAPKLLAEHFDSQGIAQIRCRSVGRSLCVRYHNPAGLTWGTYRIGSAVCGEKRWDGHSAALVIPASELTEQPATLDVTLEPITGGIHHV
ncbi:MAG: GH36-type glycosyl hydrolase domain-containing protein [Candidatus Ventricola sp.]